jgi:hypothetical protein
LFGARITMKSKVFGPLPGIAVVPPSGDEIAVADDVNASTVNQNRLFQ